MISNPVQALTNYAQKVFDTDIKVYILQMSETISRVHRESTEMLIKFFIDSKSKIAKQISSTLTFPDLAPLKNFDEA